MGNKAMSTFRRNRTSFFIGAVHTLACNVRNAAGRMLFFELSPGSRFWALAAAIVVLAAGINASPGWAEDGDVSEKLPGPSIHETTFPQGKDPFANIYFQTIYKSGFNACTNDSGQPVILLFSSSTCSHCEWVGDIFDTLVKYYVAVGSIEAHHYDINTGDDLLTEEIETEIPPVYVQLKERGDPKEYVPYFNFSCKYERVGNGHQDTDDMAAEGAEFRQVIDTLVRVLSSPETGDRK